MPQRGTARGRPGPRRAVRACLRPRATLSPRHAAGLEQARLACAEIAQTYNLARTFTDLVRHRRSHLLGEWIRQAERCGQPSIRSFASFLRQDFDAATALGQPLHREPWPGQRQPTVPRDPRTRLPREPPGSSAGTSRPSALATPNKSAPTSPPPARSPAGSCDHRTP